MMNCLTAYPLTFYVSGSTKCQGYTAQPAFTLLGGIKMIRSTYSEALLGLEPGTHGSETGALCSKPRITVQRRECYAIHTHEFKRGVSAL